MKNFLRTLLLLFATAASVHAGSGGPDAYGYIWRDSNEPNGPVYSWYDITTTGTLVTGLGDDNTAGPFGFISGFQFYWYNTEQIWIGSNGYLGFSSTNIASPFPSIPNTALPNNFIAPMLSDLIFGAPGTNAQCYYKVQGDTICVSWLNVPFWSATAPGYAGANSFQVILNKADKSITFNYLLQTGVTQNNDITIGIENIAGNLGLQHSKNIYPTDTFSVKFYYPTVVTYQAIDGGVDWNVNDGNGAAFVSRGVVQNLTTGIRNYGNQPLPTINVSSTVTRGGTTLVTNTGTVTNLAPGSEQILNLTTGLVPTLDGIYDMTTTVSGITGDLVPANNSLRTKIIAVDTTLPQIILDYSDGSPNGTGLSWSSGNGGIGYYIQPPYYPCKIDDYRINIVSDAAATGCYLKLFDDNGPNGGPGTLLDSTFAAPGTFTFNTYTLVPLRNRNAVISAGGFWILWEMPPGANITIARDTDLPISYRSMEVLQGNWASYRARFTEDFLFGVSTRHFLVRDLSVTELLNPAPGSTVTAPVNPQIRIRNIGNLANNVSSVSYRFGGTPTVTESIAANTLQPGDSLTYTFTQAWSNTIQQTANFCFWINMTGDATRTNDTICAQVTYNPSTSVAEYGSLPVRIYPNPTADLVNFEFGNGVGVAQLRLFDLQGRLLRTEDVDLGQAYPLSLSGLPDGLYQYILLQEQRQATGRLVKRAN